MKNWAKIGATVIVIALLAANIGTETALRFGSPTHNIVTTAQRNEERRSHQEQHGRQKLVLEWATLIVSVLALLAAGYTAWIFQGQLKQMRDSDRAWVKVEVESAGGLVNTGNSVIGPYFDVVLRATNIGKSPAFGIRFVVGGHLYSPQTDPAQAQREFGEATKRQVFPTTDLSQHSVLFPGDHVLNTDMGARSLAGFDPEAIKRGVSDGNGKTVAAWIIGCVDYELTAGASEHHQTAFIFRPIYAPKDKTGPVDINFGFDRDISGDDMKLVRVPTLPRQTN